MNAHTPRHCALTTTSTFPEKVKKDMGCSAMADRWTTDDTELMMHECESLDHLREILEANRSFEAMLMQEKTKRKEVQDQLQV